ncbi:MAG: flippase [candidate division KSB1 bacterium]|jgi:O-antigen/teichoic acid export membrane protein|nr:flippase [candidate division KSB1 bacterium]
MPSKENIEASRSLIGKLASGALWVITGMFIARVFGYAIRAAIAHFYGVEMYGFINTAQSLMMIFAMLALAGLNTGLPRQISFYKAQKQDKKLKQYIASGLKLGIIFSIVMGSIYYLSSDYLSSRVFNTPELEIYFKIFSFTVPLYVLFELNTSVFKGLKQMSQFTLFHEILRFGFIFILLIGASICRRSFTLTSSAYPVSFFLIDIITFYIIIKHLKLGRMNSYRWTPIDKDLLSFSIPLLFSGIFWMLLARTDTILIGAYLNQKYVGLYNAAVPIGQLILMVRQAFSPIILPLFTELVSKKDRKNLLLMYYIVAKWTTILSLPIFISMLILPKFFIWIVFGRQFLPSASVLQIVIIGFFIHTIMGPTSNLIVILGKTRLAMINSMIAVIISVGLNIILIPRFQLTGAAISSVASYLTFNLLGFFQVYRLLKVQPFRPLHLKYLLASLLPVPILLNSPIINSDLIPLLLYSIAYIGLLIIFKSFKTEDKVVLEAIIGRIRGKS